jgi:hypothetical protein
MSLTMERFITLNPRFKADQKPGDLGLETGLGIFGLKAQGPLNPKLGAKFQRPFHVLEPRISPSGFPRKS